MIRFSLIVINSISTLVYAVLVVVVVLLLLLMLSWLWWLVVYHSRLFTGIINRIRVLYGIIQRFGSGVKHMIKDFKQSTQLRKKVREQWIPMPYACSAHQYHYTYHAPYHTISCLS